MDVDEKGRYAATNETNELRYRGKTYLLKTCCNMCADAMKKVAKSPAKFKKKYFHHFEKDGDIMVLKNQHTKKAVQKLPLKG